MVSSFFRVRPACYDQLVREYLYVSQKKLRELEQRRVSGATARVTAAVKAPLGLGSVTVETSRSGRKIPRLDSAVKGLEKSRERSPVSIDDAGDAGRWVRFRAPMGYTVIDGTVIFLDPAEASASYSSGGAQRLLLHGAGEHLARDVAPQRTSVDGLSEEAAAAEDGTAGAESYASLFNPFMRQLAVATEADMDGVVADNMFALKNWMRGERGILKKALPALESHLHLPYTAEWLAGLALVTAVVPLGDGVRAICASPLYVERSAPESTGS